jgi:dTMP kinase
VTRFEARGPEFHERLRTAFLEIARADPERCVVLDARGSPDGVAGAIWRAVQGRLEP